MTPTTGTYRVWQRLSGRPGGTWAFSAAAALRVPFFTAILPHVGRMEPGYAEVTVPVSVYDRHGIEVFRADITTWVTRTRP